MAEIVLRLTGVDQASGAVTKNIDVLVKLGDEADKKLPSAFDKLRGAAQGAFSKIHDSARGAFDGMKSAAGKAFDAIHSAARSVAGGIVDVFKTALGFALGQGMIRLAKEAIGFFKDIHTEVFKTDEQIRALGMTTAEQARRVEEMRKAGDLSAFSLSEKWGMVETVWNRIYQNIITRLVPAFNLIFDKIILPSMPMVEHLFARVGEVITNYIVPAIDAFAPKAQAFIENLLKIPYFALWGDLESTILSVAATVETVFGGEAAATVYKFLEGLAGLGGAVTGQDWGGVWGIVTSALRGAWETTTTWFWSEAWPSFIELITTAWGKLQEWWTTTGWPGLVGAWNGFWIWFWGTGWTATLTAIDTAWKNLQTWWTNQGWPGIVTAWENLKTWWTNEGWPQFQILIEHAWLDLKSWWETDGTRILKEMVDGTGPALEATFKGLGSLWGAAVQSGMVAAVGGAAVGAGQFLYNNFTAAGLGTQFGQSFQGGRAGGGAIWPGTWDVGENGRERLTIGADGRGYVQPTNNYNFNLTQYTDRATAGASMHSFDLMKSFLGAGG